MAKRLSEMDNLERYIYGRYGINSVYAARDLRFRDELTDRVHEIMARSETFQREQLNSMDAETRAFAIQILEVRLSFFKIDHDSHLGDLTKRVEFIQRKKAEDILQALKAIN